MEFQYRAGNERSRSPPPPTGAAVAPANPGSADGRGDDVAGDHGEDWAVVPPPPPADPDELRRQMAKDRIRERILREEAEHWALEAEVRRELMEQLFPLLRSGSARSTGVRAEGSDAMAAPAGMTADLQSPIVLEVGLKANASAALPAKRKNPEFTAGSSVSAATSGKKQKPDLTCTVCGVTATGMKAMQDHLKGKGHRKKAAALAQRTPEAEHEQHEQQQEAEEEEGVVLPPSGSYTPSKLTMLTNAGAINEVVQMDGYLLCEVCNVRTADRVTMMCHLEGTKHNSKAQKKRQAGKPAAAGAAAAAKNGKGRSSQAVTATVAGGDPETVVVAVDGVPRTVRRVDGFLFCECCDVTVPSESIMQSHLAGKKHKNKAKVSLAQAKARDVTSVAGHTQGNGSVKGQAAQGVVVAPLATPQGDDSCAGVSVAPMEVDEAAKMEDVTAIAKEENAAAGVNSLETQGEESVKADGIAAPAQEVKIQVEGKMCTVLRQANGTLSCEPCGVHAREKDGMLLHLYTRAHWDNVPLDEKEQVDPAPAVEKVDGDGSNPVTEGTAQVEN